MCPPAPGKRNPARALTPFRQPLTVRRATFHPSFFEPGEAPMSVRGIGVREVLTARNGAEAVDLVGRQRRVVDLVMPALAA